MDAKWERWICESIGIWSDSGLNLLAGGDIGIEEEEYIDAWLSSGCFCLAAQGLRLISVERFMLFARSVSLLATGYAAAQSQ